ncbi:MAG: HAD family hydrolase [Anaerovoracaceae bacterium]
MRYQLIIFDLDGTLINSFDDLTDSLRFCLSQEGLPLPDDDQIRSHLGNGLAYLVRSFIPEDVGRSRSEEIFEGFLAYYEEHCADKSAPYPGVLTMLSKLKQAGIKLAVQSNKRDLPLQKLCRLHLKPYIDIALGERENLRLKPSADGAEYILGQMNIPAEKTVYIGDSEVDIQTAKNAGLACISVDWGFRSHDSLIQSGAKLIVSSPEELCRILTEEA